MAVSLGVDDFVKVVNPTDERLDSAGTIFEPHQTRVMSFAWMANQYGDPRSSGDEHRVIRAADGTSALIQSRTNELLKVNRFWNVGPGNGLRTWDEIPNLEFYTMDDERIYTVLDDPTGDRVTQATTTVDQQAQMQEVIRRQQAQINKLLEISGLDQDAIPSSVSNTNSDLPEDQSTSNHTTSPWESSEPIDRVG